MVSQNTKEQKYILNNGEVPWLTLVCQMQIRVESEKEIQSYPISCSLGKFQFWLRAVEARGQLTEKSSSFSLPLNLHTRSESCFPVSCEGRKAILNQSLLFIYVSTHSFIIEYLLKCQALVWAMGKNCVSLNTHSTRARLFSLLYFNFCLAQCLTDRRHLLAFLKLMNQPIKPLQSGRESFHRHVPISVLFKNTVRYLYYSKIMEEEWSLLTQ